MRLDARIHREAWSWTPYDVPGCQILRGVVWADDETAQYGQYADGERRLPIVTHQADRIRFVHEVRVVLINPLSDAEMLESEVEEIVRKAPA